MPPVRLLFGLFCVLAACSGDSPVTGDGGGTDDDGSVPDDGMMADAMVDSDPMTEPNGVPTGCVAGRATSDRADEWSFDQIHVVYAVPSDLPDVARDTNGQICNSVRAFATWFYNQTNTNLRLDTQGGLIDIEFVRLTKTDAQMRGTDPNNTDVNTGTAFVRNRIELQLEAMGKIKSNKLYAVYYEGSSVYACGGGAYPPLIQDRVGAMYLRGMPPGQTTPCGDVLPWGQSSLVPNYIDYGMLHELVHSLGFVPDAAPNEHTVGHVFDTSASAPNRDLMYSPRTSGDPGWATGQGLLIDLNSDDYWHTTQTLDLDQSSLLVPLPASPKRPVGW
jgi:hypothetical protein